MAGKRFPNKPINRTLRREDHGTFLAFSGIAGLQRRAIEHTALSMSEFLSINGWAQPGDYERCLAYCLGEIKTPRELFESMGIQLKP